MQPTPKLSRTDAANAGGSPVLLRKIRPADVFELQCVDCFARGKENNLVSLIGAANCSAPRCGLFQVCMRIGDRRKFSAEPSLICVKAARVIRGPYCRRSRRHFHNPVI
jgi:hypothetical protein